MEQFNQQIGERLRALRKSRGLSLDRTAQATGVSKAMLGQIERGESSPTVAVLWRIATGLEVPLSSLLEESRTGTQIMADGGQRRMPLDTTDQPLEPLFPYDENTGIEVFVIDLAPGKCQLSPAHNKGVTEHIIVIEGVMEVLVDQQWHRLTKGEAIRFDANQPHGYRNPGDTTASFHDLIHYQNQR